ncbi:MULTISPECIES: vWA domain-containing protein [unclassified Candidatus Frackibacter]|uniref:vWA domain-containing protein n=1 Tax=unclassified Candidatus Frackibacter TaxID=2648818 RepID=UPI000884B216|nr:MULTISPECIES: VWA domain-containing protein [unclassified Candidatus Frackibacter]SDC26157.1 hypothetical protein SAMN04515661_10516 [Candidatus Frackibacter sp. WG11]SEM53149.1 hypothetical protein SAMN04488698_10617 [Candidatus Frackibacter sp. WG12]SFL55351.1 hypothetical protein SAMN04488699_10578 [Candidatus Frackibacter sp. WG13]
MQSEFKNAIEEHEQTEVPDYIENNIIKFIQILRSLGVRVSLVEAIDAMNSLYLIDIAQKEEFKVALRSLVVKNYEEKRIYDKTFELFFQPQEEIERINEEPEEIDESEDEEIIHDPIDRKDLPEQNDKEKPDIELDLDDEQQELYDQLDSEVKEKVNEQVLDKFGEVLLHAPKTKSMVKNFISGSLKYWKAKLNENRDGLIDLESAIDVKKTGEEKLDKKLRKIVTKLDEEEEFILAKDIREIADEEMDKVTDTIKRLSRKLATKLSRRYKKSKKNKVIDLRSTLRNNIKYGGTLIDLSYRHRKLQKPKFVLICDVSDSMVKYSTFVLQFVYGLSNVVKEIESFIFAEDLEQITDYFNKNSSFADKMSKIIAESKEWGGSTNLNRALKTLNTKHQSVLTNRTVVFIVSDTKTLRIKDTAFKLDLLQRQVKDIIWLNTLPKSAWKNRTSVELFQRHSRMFKCNMIKDLQRIIKKEFL